MNARGLRRYVDDLLRGRRPKPFAPDDFEATQIRTAIDLSAARTGADVPRQDFLSDLHRRLADQLDDDDAPDAPARPTWLAANRRQVIVGTSAAATAAVAAVSVDRLLGSGNSGDDTDTAQELIPTDGAWQRVAASYDVPEGVMHPFDLGSVVGFVRRVDGQRRGHLGHLHPPGLPPVVRRSRRQAALPLPFHVVLQGGSGTDPPASDLTETVAQVGGSRGLRCDRSVRAAEPDRADLSGVTRLTIC